MSELVIVFWKAKNYKMSLCKTAAQGSGSRATFLAASIAPPSYQKHRPSPPPLTPPRFHKKLSGIPNFKESISSLSLHSLRLHR